MAVDDPEAAFTRAFAAGAKPIWAVTDQPCGSRASNDSSNHSNTIEKAASHYLNHNSLEKLVSKRPIIVTIIAGLLIAAGVFGFTIHLRELALQKLFRFEDLWIPIVDLLPAVFGVFILLGQNWARWLALAWMAFHVAISFFDSPQKVVVHVLFLSLMAYSLFRHDAKAYFQHANQVNT
jgi:hypothetical protein